MKKIAILSMIFIGLFRLTAIGQIVLGEPNVKDTAYHLLVHSDGSFIISGKQDSAAVLYKVNCQGDVLGKLVKQYTPGPAAFHEAIELPDGSIVAVGQAIVDGTVLTDHLLLVKTTADLTETVAQTLLVSDRWARGRSVALTPDGNLLVLGQGDSVWVDFSHLFLLPISASTLEPIGSPVFYSFGLDYPHRITAIGNGEYLVSTFALIGNIFNLDALIRNRLVTLKVNAQGQEIWRYTYEYVRTNKYNTCRAGGAVVGAPPLNNRIVVCGAVHTQNNPDSLTDAVFILLNTDGVPLDTLEIHLPGRQEVTNTIALADQPGTFLSVGGTFPGTAPGTALTLGVTVVADNLVPIFTINDTALPITLHDAKEVPYGRVALLGSLPEGFIAPTRDIILLPPDIEDIQLQYQNCVLSPSFSVSEPSFQWYRDGSPIPGATSINYTPNESGYYHVKITDPLGCSGLSDTLFVSWPKADFSWNATGSIVHFISHSTNADSCWWAFGDGTLSNQKEPTHLYLAEGDYIVTLTIYSDSCATHTITKTIHVLFPPTAGFTASLTSGCAPLTVQFTNTSSPNATDFLWTFPGGEPASSTEKNPTVMYSTPGVFPVKLTVSNSSGSDSMVQSDYITIEGPPTVAFEVSISARTVTFINNSTKADSYLWDFGDGNTSTDSHPVHTYDQDGAYVVTLVASNPCGQETFTHIVSITTPPTAGFTASLTSGCAPLTVQFTNTSSANATDFLWTFPGGEPGFSTEKNPAVIYSTPGIYSVKLIVTNPYGSDSLIQQGFVEIFNLPTAEFTYSVSDLTVIFENKSQNSLFYTWDFGDGTTSNRVVLK